MSAPPDGAKPAPATATESYSPESPTTARPLEMDDDDVQETGILGDEPAGPPPATTATAAAAAPASQEVPPAKPPRPVTEAQKNEQILKEAFPSIEASIIRAVLTASGGRIDPAFNALLQMTDPEAAEQDMPPPPPPRPVAQPQGPTSTEQSQLEADEQYARRLAEHYDNVGAYEARTSNRGGPGMPRGRQQTGLRPDDDDDREHSFLDDDLPVIRDSLKKGFMETQTKVNSWFNNLKKQINEQFDDDDDEHRPAGSSSFNGRPSRDQTTRRSNDYDRYDADPELLSDDFAGMKFRSDGTPVNSRAAAGGNPNLFRPPPPSKSPKPHDGRKVAFNDSVEDIDAYEASPKLPPKDAPSVNTAKASKWQPLSTVEPSPIADNDPFSLGDSEDEKEAKDKNAKSGTKEIQMEDTERLRQAAAEAMADSLVDDKKKEEEKKDYTV